MYVKINVGPTLTKQAIKIFFINKYGCWPNVGAMLKKKPIFCVAERPNVGPMLF